MHGSAVPRGWGRVDMEKRTFVSCSYASNSGACKHFGTQDMAFWESVGFSRTWGRQGS